MFEFGPRRIALVVAIVALTIRGAAQVLPRKSEQPASRTAMIVGQVVDATTGAPVPEAIVTLTMPQQAVPDLRVGAPPPAAGGRVMADAEGRFFFSDLPAGEFWLQAARDGYASGAYRQRRPGSSVGAQRLRLNQGERRFDVTLRVWKYGVIAGRVIDEAGEPVVGVAVRALVRRFVAGRPQYGTVSYLVPSALTDDRGMFRLSRVEPGTYVVAAPSTQTTVPLSVMHGMDAAALRTELFWAGITEAPPLGDPRAQQVSDAALLTMNSVLIPPPVSASGRMQVYRTTYHAAATTAGAATPITIQAGEERTDLAIAMRPVPAMRVSGRLVTPDGSPPPPMTIQLVGDAMRDVATATRPSSPAEVGFETVTGMSDPTGRFTLLGVPPGEYVLKHASSFLARATREGRPAYWTSQRVIVGDSDLADLTVELRPAFRVAGRMEFRGASGLQPAPLIPGVVFETASGEPAQFAAESSRETATFSSVAAGGRYILRVPSSGGWYVESITLDGKDITDKVFDLQSDATSIVITYTDRRSGVSGGVRDARGNASATAMVLAFPVDRQRWSNYGTNPRHLRSVYTTEIGGYTFDHLPPGEYYVIAIDDAEGDDWMDPEKLAAFARRAAKLTIAAGDPPKTLDLVLRSSR